MTDLKKHATSNQQTAIFQNALTIVMSVQKIQRMQVALMHMLGEPVESLVIYVVVRIRIIISLHFHSIFVTVSKFQDFNFFFKLALASLSTSQSTTDASKSTADGVCCSNLMVSSNDGSANNFIGVYTQKAGLGNVYYQKKTDSLENYLFVNDENNWVVSQIFGRVILYDTIIDSAYIYIIKYIYSMFCSIDCIQTSLRGRL